MSDSVESAAATIQPPSGDRTLYRVANLVQGVALVVAVVSLLVLLRTLPVEAGAAALRDWIAGLGVWGPIAFGAIYALATVFALPGLILTLSAGALFGLLTGFVTASLASTTGAGLAFLVARHFARDRVRRAAKARPLFGAIDGAIGEGGWRIVALLRLSPAVPFNLQNFMFGLTPVRFRSYLLTSWIAMMPGTFLYVYVGHLTGAAVSRSGRTAAEWVLLGAGLVATLVVSWYVTRLARRQLAERQSLAGLNEATPEPGQPAQAASNRGWPWRATLTALVALMLSAAAGVSVLRPSLLTRALPFGPPQADFVEKYSHRLAGATFDHSTFDRLLRRHVDADGRVDYAGLSQDAGELDSYLDQVAKAPCDELGRDEKLAFLINVYNAATLRLILDFYPLDSIRDIPPAERWKDERWALDGRAISLDQIEHVKIRGHFAEPRIHFVLVCAAIGCPPLRREAYTGDELDRQLEEQTHAVHQAPRWVQWDPESRELALTPLFDWYRDDFEKSAGTILAYVAQRVDGLQPDDEVDIRWLDYDWALNGSNP